MAKAVIPAAIQGARLPGRQLTWSRSDGTAEDLTGATITARMQNKATGVASDVTGTLTVIDAANGVFTWALSAADVATVGDFDLQFTASYGSLAARTYKADWSVRAAI